MTIFIYFQNLNCTEFYLWNWCNFWSRTRLSIWGFNVQYAMCNVHFDFVKLIKKKKFKYPLLICSMEQALVRCWLLLLYPRGWWHKSPKTLGLKIREIKCILQNNIMKGFREFFKQSLNFLTIPKDIFPSSFYF